jgi:acetolactate synthase-1/2/3 large subunit
MDGNDQMTGAESLVRTLVKSGVSVSFSNPGTSEMHSVAALDRVEGMRCVLGLFEGVCSGAADGYYRMTDKPAATLLHLGPGLANAAANLHNAKKAGSGIVNIVGEHATHHIKYDTPLTADIEGIAKPFSHWVKTSPNPGTVGKDGAAAVQAARQGCGQIATLILPADCAWTPGGEVAEPLPVPTQSKPSADAVKAAAKALSSGEPAMLLLGGRALRARGLELAGKIAAKTGCKVQGSGGTARLSRGAGRVQITRLHFVVEQAQAMLKGMKQMVLVGAKEPAAFFAYPGKPSILTPEGCTLTKLCAVEDDCEAALEALAAELGATGLQPAGVAQPKRPDKPTGKFTLDGLGQALGAVLPEGAIVIDESVTTGRGFFPFSAGAPPHDWLNNMGGSIGFGAPVAVGAAVACPDRKVVCMIGDGSAMYTIQALWTMARDNLDVCVIIFANRSYQILYSQLSDVGAPNPGPRAIDMLTLDRPTLKFVELAKGMGVEGAQAHDLEGLNKQLQYAMSTKGPYLIEVVM